MKKLKHLLDNNWAWAESVKKEDPEFFKELSKKQAPEYLWIGCSDSRVPANQIISLAPGELFVHRNIANVVVHTDMNCLSVIQFAVEALHVKHIIVCGHYGCGGVKAALGNQEYGLVDHWLGPIEDVIRSNASELDGVNGDEKLDLLCELNVKEQVKNVCNTTVVKKAWRQGRELAVHGWIYGLNNGLIKDLDTTISSVDE